MWPPAVAMGAGSRRQRGEQLGAGAVSTGGRRGTECPGNQKPRAVPTFPLPLGLGGEVTAPEPWPTEGLRAHRRETHVQRGEGGEVWV